MESIIIAVLAAILKVNVIRENTSVLKQENTRNTTVRRVRNLEIYHFNN